MFKIFLLALTVSSKLLFSAALLWPLSLKESVLSCPGIFGCLLTVSIRG